MATPRYGNLEPNAATVRQRRLDQRMKAARERAKRRGERCVDHAVQLLVNVMGDSGRPMMERMRAAENILDRFGHPRMQATEVTGNAFEGNKYLVVKNFDAPPSFNPNPPGDEPDEKPH